MTDNKHRKTFWEFFINNRKFVLVLSLAIAVIGIISVYNIPKESSPEVDIPMATVSTPYPGASPEDVESLVTDVIEDEVLGISNINKVSSRSSEGFSSVSIEFEVGVDKDKKVNEVEDAVDRAERDLPSDANTPRVQDISISEVFPVLRFSLSGPYNVNQLKDIAEELKDEIKRVPNVSQVNISGGEEREFRVLVDKTALDNYGLGLTQVTNAISSANSDIPIGNIETGGANYTVNMKGRVSSAQEIENIPVTSIEDSVVYIRDVAEVKDTFKERSSISRVSLEGEEPQPAVSLSVVKGSEGNILEIVNRTQERIKKAQGGIIPENVNMEVIDNQAENIRNDIWSLTNNGIQTIIIILVLLMIFVGWREALLSALAVPLTFLISFIVLNYIGYTLNFLTLFALILSLGILVDSIIVITEGTNRKLREGLDVKQAAIATVREYHLPLIAGTLTTVFAFLPMLLTSGIMGEFIKSLPVTVTITLLAALFVALGVLTSLSVRWLRKSKRNKTSLQGSSYSSFLLDKKILPYYIAILKYFLKKKIARRTLAVILIILFSGAMMLPAQGILKQDLFPEQDQDYFAINIEELVGTPLKKTSETASQVEELFLGDERIKSFQVNIGSAFNTYISNSSGGEHVGHVIVNLKKDRDKESFEIAEEYRKKISDLDVFPAEIRVVQLTAGPPSGSAITVNITGPSLVELDELSEKIRTELENIPGSTNVQVSKEESHAQFAVDINRAKARIYGVNTQQVAGVLRNAISGSEATVVRGGGDDTDVTVKYDLNGGGSKKISPDSISALTIATPAGDIPLSNFTSISLESKRAFIDHEGGERIVKVTGESTSDVSPITVTNSLKQEIEKMDIPADYSISFGGEEQDIEESFNDMMKALLLGVFIIAMIMVLQFKSFRQPLFILVSIPLSVIGIFPGLVLTGQPLSFPGVIGLVALAGIVVNNAILLIDAINQRRIQGMDKEEAVIAASQVRFQPILLTAATTVGGMIPLAFSNPTWAPIAFSIIFGLSFSTVLTLVVVPTLYFTWGEEKMDLMEN